MAALLQGLLAKLQDSGERAMLSVIGYLAASLLMMLAVGAFIYAAAVALTEAYGPVVSGVVIGAVAALLGLMTIAWLSLRRRRLRREVRLRRLAQPALAEVAATALPALLQKNPVGVLIVAAAAGFLLQRSTQHRK